MLPKHFEMLGIVSEKELSTLLYIVYSSCRRNKTLGALIAASSSSGKSFISKRVLKLFPDQWTIRASRFSEAVLEKHQPDHFKNKIVYLDESEGKQDRAAYTLRIMQSEGRYSYTVTSKDGAPEEQTIKGPLSLIETTSEDLSLFKEDNLNRTLILSTDQSKDQTNRIKDALAKQAQMLKKQNSIDRIVADHHTFQLSLRNYPVVIPYASKIIPSCRDLNSRRDFSKMLQVIETVCYLRQTVSPTMKGDSGTFFLKADETDYKIAYPLLEFAFRSTSDKANALRTVYDDLVKCAKGPSQFNRRKFKEWTGYGDTKSKTQIKDLIEYGFIEVVKAARSNQPAVYSLCNDIPQATSNLIHPDDI